MSKYLTAFTLSGTDYIVPLYLRVYDVAADGVITKGAETEVGDIKMSSFDFVMTTPSTGVLVYATMDDVLASSVVLRTIGISGGTTPTYGSAFTLASSASTEVLPNVINGINANVEYTLKIHDVGGGKFLVVWMTQGEYKLRFELVTLTGSTFSITASGYMTYADPGDYFYSYIQSVHVLSPTQFLVAGVDRTGYNVTPDPIFGQNGGEDFGADFTAIITVSGSSLTIGSFTYAPVTPGGAGYLNGRSIPSDYLTPGTGTYPDYRRRVISTKLIPAGPNHFISVRQFGFTYYYGGYYGGYSYIHGIEFHPVVLSGTTVTFGPPVTLPWSIYGNLVEAAAVESGTDSYMIFFTVTHGQPYGYWVNYDKTSNLLTEQNLPIQILDTTGNLFLDKMTLSQLSANEFILFGFDQSAYLSSYNMRMSSIRIDTSLPFYSYVNEDKGNRQNVAVKKGVAMMAWGEGLDKKYTYRPVVLNADRTVTFKTAVKYPTIAPPGSYMSNGYTYGDIAKLSEGKFIACSEDWSTIGTLSSTNEVTFGPTQAVPVTANPASNPAKKIKLCPLSETKVVAIFNSEESDYGVVGSMEGECIAASIGTISGNSITWAAPQVIWENPGWECLYSWEANPESYRHQAVVLDENRILLVMQDASNDERYDEELYGINQFLVLTIEGETITVTPGARLENSYELVNPWDDPDTGIYYDGYSLLPVSSEKAIFLFTQSYQAEFSSIPDPYPDPVLFAQVVKIDGTSVSLGEKSALIPKPALPQDFMYCAQGAIFGYGAWGVVRARQYNWSVDEALPAIILFNIDGDIITLFSSTRYDNIEDNYGGAISAPREDAAFLWTMDWEHEFGSTDRAMSKVIYLEQ